MKNLSTDEIRKSWIKIFEQNNYIFLEPVSLIPDNDPSLLWINSGVATLKKRFNEKRDTSENLVNCQPVIRTDDLENVRDGGYHQSLFEMLGNFSIGSNFKQEIIPIVWSWFTCQEWLGISPEQLIITYWEEDLETYKIWRSLGVSAERLLPGNKETNFWDMGEGPCGANSEIYFDFQSNEKLPEKIDQLENKRFIEICNIVFPEFYHSGEKFFELSAKCVDTGAGLERIAMVLQRKSNTFQIDIWKEPLLLLEKTNKRFFSCYFVIVDHLRTVIFALLDLKTDSFSRKGRGYVLRKLLKKVSLSFYLNSLNPEILRILLEKIISANSSHYKRFSFEKERIIQAIVGEFAKNMNFFKSVTNELKKTKLTGKKLTSNDIFFFYDTKGFPLEILQSFYEKEENFSLIYSDFQKLVTARRNNSQDDRKKKGLKVF